jgi:hypothetical protein
MKCKSKMHSDSFPSQTEWLSLTKHTATNAVKVVGKKEPLYTFGWNLFSHYGNQYGGSSKQLKNMEMPYDPAITLLGIHLKE